MPARLDSNVVLGNIVTRKLSGTPRGSYRNSHGAARPAARHSVSPASPEIGSCATNRVTIDDYNREMAEKMGWMDNPYEYRPERGLYYHFITSDVIVGSQPRVPRDIQHLAEDRGVQAILSLQQDKDLHHWGVNLHDLQHTAKDGNVVYIRNPAVDFDPSSLRSTLPSAVASLEQARLNHGITYVHCTAGLGRAPAVAIAQLYWMTDLQLDEAYAYLTGIRPCGPNKDAIRGATYDLLSGQHWDGFQHLPGHAFATLSNTDRDVIREKLLGAS